MLREELTHGRQAELDQNAGSAEAVRTELMAHPLFGKARAALEANPLYAGSSDRRAVNEVTAKIAAGSRAEMGLSFREGRTLLASYYDALVKAHGVDAADRVLEYADRESRATVHDRSRRIRAELAAKETAQGRAGPTAEGVSGLSGGRGDGTNETPPGGGGESEPHFAAGSEENERKPAFLNPFGEAAALKAKRDAALAEIKESQATPGQKRFGQKVSEYFTGERDLWGAKINQAIARERAKLPEHVEQEGLSLMRDFKNRPWELAEFLDGRTKRSAS
jgi:hypothetical protein